MATSSKGFALLELIVGLAIFLFMLVISLPMWEGFLQISEMAKIDSACRLLATDIADIQNKALFRNLFPDLFLVVADRHHELMGMGPVQADGLLQEAGIPQGKQLLGHQRRLFE